MLELWEEADDKQDICGSGRGKKKSSINAEMAGTRQGSR